MKTSIYHKLYRFLALSALVVVVAIKSIVISLPANDIVEIGEMPNGAWSSECHLIVPADLKTISSSRDIRSKKCSLYWERHSMRGFYLHHYASLQDIIGSDELPSWIRSARHQYGISGRLLIDVADVFNMSISPQEFAIASLLIGISGLVSIALIPVKIGIADECEFTGFLFLLALALGSLNVDQLLVSPGFTPLRIMPILGTMVSFRILASDGCNKVRLSRGYQEGVALSIFALSCIAMSIQFLLMTVASFGMAWLSSCVATRSNSNGLFFDRSVLLTIMRKKLWCCLLISVFCLALLMALNIDVIGALGSSASDAILQKKPWVCISIIVLTGLMFFGTRKIGHSSCSRGLGSVFNEPVLYQLISFALYSTYYWGSPNHLYVFLLLSTYPLAIMLGNIYQGQSIVPSKRELAAIKSARMAFLGWTGLYNKSSFYSHFERFNRLDKMRAARFNGGYSVSRIANSLLVYYPRLAYIVLPCAAVFAGIYFYFFNASLGLTDDFATLNKREDISSSLFVNCNNRLQLGLFSMRSCNKNASIDDFLVFTKTNKDSQNTSRIVLSDKALLLPDFDFKGSEYGFPVNKQIMSKNLALSRALENSLFSYEFCLYQGLDRLETGRLCNKSIDSYVEKLGRFINASQSLDGIGSSSIFLDPTLEIEIRQLYIGIFHAWIMAGQDIRNESVKERWAKLAKYVWRSELRKSLESSPSWKRV